MTTRPLVAALLGSALVAVLSGCGSTLPADQVASTVVTQLKGQGVTVDGDAVSCPGDVPVELGRTVRCGFTAGGQPVDAVATVSSVDGSTVNFDITTEAKPVPAQVLENVVTAQLRRGGVPVDDVACAGPLPPQPGQAQTCTVSGPGRQTRLTTTVTEVRGGFVSFSIEMS